MRDEAIPARWSRSTCAVFFLRWTETSAPQGHEFIVQQLVQAGADVDREGRDG